MRRIDRLAVPAALRLAVLLRPAARRRGERLLAARPGRRRREPSSATRRWYRPDTLVLETEFDTPSGTVRITDCMPVRDSHPHLVRSVEGVSGTVDMRMELAVRFDYGEVVPWVTTPRRADPAHGRARLRRAVAPRRGEGPGPADGRRLHRHRAASAIPSRWSGTPPTRTRRRRWTATTPSHLTEAYWTEWADALLLRGSLPRRGGALAHHPQGADLRADRRHRRRRDDVAARGARGQAQLGLPLLLAARRHAHPRGADAGRLLRRGDGLARLAAARRGGRRHEAADHVRRRRRAAPRRVGGGLAARLRGLGPGAHRQRRLRAVPARRLRRGDVGALLLGPRRGRADARPPGRCRPS